MMRLVLLVQSALVIRNGCSFTPSGVKTTRLHLNMLAERSSSSSPSDILSAVGADDYKSLLKTENYKDVAAKLRREAQELEVALREEARQKGLSEDAINKLIPITGQKAVVAPESAPIEKNTKRSKQDVLSSLGYLPTGNAVNMVSELDNLKSRKILSIWNSQDFSKDNFQASNQQLKSKANIEPAKLRLDDVGYEYQKVFIGALFFATFFGVSSSFVGGEIGFLLGYAAALFPVLLVGIGSIAPGVIGDVLNKIKYATNEEEKAKYVVINAAKFLCGYATGLPVASFTTGGFSNTVDFFQLRPSGKTAEESRQMFASRRFSQLDISRCSVACGAGAVAECMAYGEASGTSPGEVNLLYELLNACDPPLSPEKAQNHIRWSVLSAFEILRTYKDEFNLLKEAFATGKSLEECVAIIEGTV